MMRIPNQCDHLRDDVLLLLLQDELRPGTTRQVQEHLHVCAPCRQRLDVLRKVEEALPAMAAGNGNAIPEPGTARARLATGLLAVGPEPSLVSRWKAALLRPTMFIRIATVAALCVVVVTYRQATRPLQDLMAAYEETGPKPDHALTPGSASALSVAQVCERNDDDLDPKLPIETQQAVFRAYRLDARSAKAYQVDYLINPQLGGDSSLQNLWPEPYHATVWNATAKDALETRLHTMVCSQQIDLQAAQRELATDWISAYKKHFHATRPVRTVAVVDQPHE